MLLTPSWHIVRVHDRVHVLFHSTSYFDLSQNGNWQFQLFKLDFFFVLILNIKVFMLKNVLEKPWATSIRPQGGPDGKLVRTCCNAITSMKILLQHQWCGRRFLSTKTWPCTNAGKLGNANKNTTKNQRTKSPTQWRRTTNFSGMLRS